jgi:hypothetical protein
MNPSSSPCHLSIRRRSTRSVWTIFFMRNILSFVGKNQYRFVGAVNRHFRTAYIAVFSPTTTLDNVTTVEHANVCYHEIKDAPSQRKCLCKVASKMNHRDVLKYLFVEGCTWDGEMATAAAQAGQLELLQWLVRKRGPVNATTFAAAATHSDLAILQWLYVLPRMAGDDCPWDTTTCSTAAMYGHWNVLKWLRTKGCPWGPETCSNAALNGHLHVLLWAHSNGCPWDRTDVLGVRILALWPQ